MQQTNMPCRCFASTRNFKAMKFNNQVELTNKSQPPNQN